MFPWEIQRTQNGEIYMLNAMDDGLRRSSWMSRTVLDGILVISSATKVGKRSIVVIERDLNEVVRYRTCRQSSKFLISFNMSHRISGDHCYR